MAIHMDAERIRLEEERQRKKNWKRWGPYVSERAWGTVREDYSEHGTAWDYFPHDHARSKAYRWGEDGLAGICDRHQYLCFAIALWNERDPILKERLFGLTGPEGNHGEDVKEYYYYLDSTPTHSYMKYLYKYPQHPYPYGWLIEEGGRRRGAGMPEFELIDTGIFNDSKYFDVFVEYAKAEPEDILIRIRVVNRGSEPAPLHLLPTIWFRNTWSWGLDSRKPHMTMPKDNVLQLEHDYLGAMWLYCDGSPELLFVENETNARRLYGNWEDRSYAKDGIEEYIIGGRKESVNPKKKGTKAAAHYPLMVPSGGEEVVQLRLTRQRPPEKKELFGKSFDESFRQRETEANEFYKAVIPEGLSTDSTNAVRQCFAGLMWTKQFYYYEVGRWLKGDPAFGPPPAARKEGRNHNWTHLYNADVISMPDKWEYPWYAAWDLAFHCIPIAFIDPQFAKEQLILLLREWYMHPSGAIPSYEWKFGDVNPPVQAWAAWRLYKIERKHFGKGDRVFLERVFHKLLLNFTWWVNRKDAHGRNIFQGGFLGLDNVGVFDRSAPLPIGGTIEQSDATSWMGMFCLNMMAIAIELAQTNPAYEDVASKFFEHFVYICHAMNNLGGEKIALWDEVDGFYYDFLQLPSGRRCPLKIRSTVGLTPLFAQEVLDSEVIDRLPGFKRRLQWFVENRPELGLNMETISVEGNRITRLLSLVNRERLKKLLKYMLSEDEFLSPFGIRSLSRLYEKAPYFLNVGDVEYTVDYEPAESRSGLFGGNSNWRGPIWFPMNYLIIESLQKFHYYFQDTFEVEFPTGSGKMMNLGEVARELSRRLVHIFLRDSSGKRPVYGSNKIMQEDPHWKDLILFYEFFHGNTGEGLGASHQTGWTGLFAKLLIQSGD